MKRPKTSHRHHESSLLAGSLKLENCVLQARLAHSFIGLKAPKGHALDRGAVDKKDSPGEFPHLLLHFIWKKLIYGQKLHHASTESMDDHSGEDGACVKIADFIETFVDDNEDVKYYTYKICLNFLEKEIKSRPPRSKDSTKALHKLIDMLIFILLNMAPPPTMASEIGQFLCMSDLLVPQSPKSAPHKLMQTKSYKNAFSALWLLLLKNFPSGDVKLLHKVLNALSLKVIPYFSQPTLLMDFLTEAYNSGGITGLLALGGLFVLIHRHNLDYPDFYQKVYASIDASLFHVKYRSKFFKLIDLFLKSTHLPAYLVAAFIKKISRYALFSPPASLMWIIPFVYNLLLRHPSTRVLIHRAADHGDSANSQKRDPYRLEEADPAKSLAMDSSLWELQTLQHHAYPKISAFAKIFSEKFTKQEYDLSRYHALSYHVMIENHINESTKHRPNENCALSPISKAPFVL